jgi:hypothetical protein
MFVAGQARVARQIELVAELRAKGLPTAQDVRVLEAMEVSLDAMRTLSQRGAWSTTLARYIGTIAEHHRRTTKALDRRSHCPFD